MNRVDAFWKPKGCTSYDVIRKLKTYLGKTKIGHAGTLDPFAEGILIILFGKSTKKQENMMALEKEYTATIQLGRSTTTLDPEGEITEESPVTTLDENKINAVLEEFIGEISQVPPIYSALKKDGKPLYKYARQGKEVKIEPRTINIFDIRLISYTKDTIVIQVRCGKGTYIRSLARDVAIKLGTVGYLTSLTRTRIGKFDKDSAITIERIPNWLSTMA